MVPHVGLGPNRGYGWGLLIAEYSSGAHCVQTASRSTFACFWVVRTSGWCVLLGVLVMPGVPAVVAHCWHYWAERSRNVRTSPASGIPDTRSARPKARRRTARSKHSIAGCSQAPRPGNRPARSGTSRTVPGWSSGAASPRPVGLGRTSRLESSNLDTTILNRTDRASRRRHPTHVRTGPEPGGAADPRVAGAGAAGVVAGARVAAWSGGSARSSSRAPRVEVSVERGF